MPTGIPQENAPAVAQALAVAQDHALRAPIEGLLAAITATGAARAATVRALDGRCAELRLFGAARVSTEFRARLAVVDGHCGACGEAMALDHEVRGKPGCQCARLLDTPPSAEAVRVFPLRHGERAYGVLALFGSGEHDIHPDVTAMLPALAELVGLALDNCRMSEEKLVASLAQERLLLANEIHDALAQNLTSMRMRASLLRTAMHHQDLARAENYLSEINASLSVAHARVRELITHFRTEMDPRGLLPALESTIAELGEAGTMKIGFINRVRALDLTAEQELQVFYIVREALTNAVRHSGATEVRLSLARWADRYEFEIEDNGVGIEAHNAEQHGHFGLNIMRERARRIGGRLAIEALAAGGTRVHLSFPVPHPDIEDTA